MKKFLIELIGTCFFIIGILGAVSTPTLLTPIYIGLTLTALVYMGGPISGAHYNPAVTFGLFINKKISLFNTCLYIVAQLLGAYFAFNIVTKGLGMHVASVELSAGLREIFIAELLFTFALVSVVYHVAMNRSVAGNSYYGLAIGLILMTEIMAVGKISGGFFNPAVLLGVGLGGISLKLVGIILLAQFIGATCATGIYRFVVGK